MVITKQLLHTQAQYNSAFTRSGEQCSPVPDIRCDINSSGSKFPRRGWSVSRYSDILLAAVSLSTSTLVQDRISRLRRRGSHISGIGVDVLLRVFCFVRCIVCVDEEPGDRSVTGLSLFAEFCLLPFSFWPRMTMSLMA